MSKLIEHLKVLTDRRAAIQPGENSFLLWDDQQFRTDALLLCTTHLDELAALASQGAEPVYSDNPADDNYLCPAGRAQRGLPPLASETAEGAASELADRIDPFTRQHAPDHLTMAAAAKLLRSLATPPAATQVPAWRCADCGNGENFDHRGCMQWKFECFIDFATGGKLSKSSWALETLKAAVTEHINAVAESFAQDAAPPASEMGMLRDAAESALEILEHADTSAENVAMARRHHDAVQALRKALAAQKGRTQSAPPAAQQIGGVE